MYTLRDYIIWRGDLSFEQDPFNEIDNIVFCCVSYVNLGQVFQLSDKKSMTIGEIASTYFDVLRLDENEPTGAFFADYPRVLQLLRGTKRYSNILVKNYYGMMDKEKVLQFAAMEFCIPDGSSYIAFRGTDESFVGWKEDLLLAVDVVEAEKEACNYLSEVMLSGTYPVRIGGHSKGGHLAIYAALFSDDSILQRITDIYSNDGPGFLESFILDNNFSRIEDKIKCFMPEETVVSMLLSGVGTPIVVKSQKKKIMQHTPTNWAVEGTGFVRASKVSKFSVKMHAAISDWLSAFSDDEMKAFADDLFDVLEASGADNFCEITGGGVKGIQSLIHRLKYITPETKEKMILIVKEMIVG